MVFVSPCQFCERLNFFCMSLFVPVIVTSATNYQQSPREISEKESFYRKVDIRSRLCCHFYFHVHFIIDSKNQYKQFHSDSENK